MAGNGIVIVGAGQAGYQVAASLRAEGFEGPVRLVGEEPHLPYQRPPLSKAYLMGKARADSLPFRPLAFYEQNGIELLQGVRALKLDPAARRLETSAGPFSYDGLALMTGGRPRLLPVPGAEAQGVLYLRTRDDSDAIRAALDEAESVVVIGGGFIGLEVAASARMLGKDIVVLEALDRLMARALAPAMSDFFQRLHGRHGARIVLGCEVAHIEAKGGRATGVVTRDGDRHPADLVIVGIGIEPGTELAADAGLPCRDGILVDDHARTADARIVAAGDCANHPNAFTTGRIRLESVQNAIDQAKTAAASLIGKARPYRDVPWFWSDQYDVKLQMVGLSRDADRMVLRGQGAEGRFSAFYFKRHRLIAIDSINRPADHMLGRRLIAAGAGPTPEQAADESFDLKALLTQPAH